MRIYVFLFSLLMAVGGSAQAAPQPVKLSQADIDGALLAKSAISGQEQSELGALSTEDAEVFLSSDRRLNAGIYRSGAARFSYDQPYGVDEFMYFLSGRLTLTSSDGTVTEVGPGEAVTIPKQWTGIWESSAYTKIYVIYSPDALLPQAGAAAHD